MVLLNPIPLNIIQKINIIQTCLGITDYNIYLYKVDSTDKIIGFFDKNRILERDKFEKIDKILIVLWQNEYDPNPSQKLVTVNFRQLKTVITPYQEILQIAQLDKHNYEIYTPLSSNRYVYSLNTHLFKEYEIIPGKLYCLSAKSNSEMVYYKDGD
jgi:hypothetical protein